MTATSTSPWFRSPRTSISAPATRMRPGSIGMCGPIRTRPGERAAKPPRRQERLSEQVRQNLDARQDQMDRLRHRPHAELRHLECAASLDERADDGCARRIYDNGPMGQRHPILQVEHHGLRRKDRAADQRLADAQGRYRQVDAYRQYQPGHRTGMGLVDARRWRGAVQRPGQGYGELYL